MVEAVVFDMDGVLVNSVNPSYRARHKVLKSHGVDLRTIPDQHNEEHKGTSTKNLLASVEEYYGLKLDHAEFSQKVGEHMAIELHGTTADMDLIRLIRELENNHVLLGLASSGGRSGVETKLGLLGLTKTFQTIVTANDVTNHKPHPEVYLAAMQQLGVSPARTIAIEDSKAGVDAGRAAGLKVVGFTKYNDNKQPLPGAATTIDGWEEISYEGLSKLLA